MVFRIESLDEIIKGVSIELKIEFLVILILKGWGK